MKWFLVCGAVIVGLVSVTFIERATNNVCKTFHDYYSDRDNNENCYHNPDHELTVPEIIQRYGYPVETYRVTTLDGYIITVFRIPRGKNSTDKKIGKPVFLQHGFASSSACFVNIREKSLGFILADEGYDVWLGNFRGSIYSRDHTHLSDMDSTYWNFSIHEYGIYDIPAQLDLVSKVTKEKITYIGFSMGTMALYIYGTTNPQEAREKIQIFINLAPAAFLGEFTSAIKYIVPYWFLVEPAAHVVTQGKIFARLFIPPEYLKYICYPFPIQMKFCQLPDMIAFGFNYEQCDPETLPIHLLQSADWASLKAFTHLTQLLLSPNFQNYDYGTTTNTKVYGSPEPPHYNLTKMTIPTYFIRAENDLIITKKNVERLYNSLPKATKPYDIYVIKDENFNHLGFISAKDVKSLLYDHIVDFIRSQ